MYPEVQLDSTRNCYRTVIPKDVFTANPELSPLLEAANLWWGEHRNVVGVPIQNNSAYSLELAHPGSTGTAGDWSRKGDVDEMRATFSAFTPIVKLMEFVKPEDLLVWKLVQLPPLEKWSMGNGRVVLIADGMRCFLVIYGCQIDACA